MLLLVYSSVIDNLIHNATCDSDSEENKLLFINVAATGTQIWNFGIDVATV